MASETTKPYEIVILGGNLGGVNVAHYLFRHTIPSLKKLDSSKEYRLTIVSPSTHFYWKIGAPRALINKELIPLDTIFRPIKEAFSGYANQFNFVQGLATSVAAADRTVTVKKSDGSSETIVFNSLIISTGTTSNSALWTLQGDHVISQEALDKMHTVLPEANTILVAGGGAVGVETAGEISTAYPKAKVALLSGASKLLERAPVAATGQKAEDRLKDASVEVVHNLRVQSQEDGPGKQVKVVLSDGSERLVDLYIDATGGKPNTDYVPADWLNEKKLVKVDTDTLRVQGVNSNGVYALGDAASYSNQTYMFVDAAVAPLCSSLGVDITKSLGKEEKENQSSGWWAWLFGSTSPLEQKTFQPVKGTMLVPTGRKGGVGSLFGFQLPSIMVHIIKGKTFFMEMVPKMMQGDLRAKA